MARYVAQVLILFAAISTTIAPKAASAQLGYHLNSLELLVGESDVVARGVVTGITRHRIDEHWEWSIVTLDVGGILKGHDLKRLTFGMKTSPSNKMLEEWMESQRDAVWMLRRTPADDDPDGEGDRESLRILRRYQTDFYARGDGWGAMLIDGRTTEGPPPPPILTMDLRLLGTPEEILAAIEEAVHADESVPRPVRQHDMSLPRMIVQQTGRSGDANRFSAPVDKRLEQFARRLIESPHDVTSELQQREANEESRRSNVTYLGGIESQLRVEGVKALEYFKSDENTAILKGSLDDPTLWFRTTLGEGETSTKERVYVVREAAYQILQSWDIAVDEPLLKEPDAD